MYELRPYQEACVKKILWSQQFEGGDIVCLPTGAGKSIIIAELVHRLNKPVLLLAPTREITLQNLEKVSAYLPSHEIGIYSASLNRKEIKKCTLATIGSIYKKPELFAHFSLVLADEAHLINVKDSNGMYMSFLNGISPVKVVGLTATPYRLDVAYENLGDGVFIAHTATKLINRTKGNFWKRVVFNINISNLIEEGYLTPLKYIDKTILEHDQIPTNISQSDFNLDKFAEKISENEDKLMEAIFFAEELCKHVLVFCPNVDQAEWLQTQVASSEVVTAKTKRKERERIINGFRNGNIKTVFNVGVLTTGFDFPELDGIVLLRPTKSIGLYYQMLGRGVRSAKGKTHCKVIDLTGTVKFLGKVETIKMEKDQMWELRSETGSWHNKSLYSVKIGDVKQDNLSFLR